MLDPINLLTANMRLVPRTLRWLLSPVWKITGQITVIICTLFIYIYIYIKRSSFTFLHSSSLIRFPHFLASFAFFRLLLLLSSCQFYSPFLLWFFIASLNDMPQTFHNLCFLESVRILLFLGCTMWVRNLQDIAWEHRQLCPMFYNKHLHVQHHFLLALLSAGSHFIFLYLPALHQCSQFSLLLILNMH